MMSFKLFQLILKLNEGETSKQIRDTQDLLARLSNRLSAAGNLEKVFEITIGDDRRPQIEKILVEPKVMTQLLIKAGLVDPSQAAMASARIYNVVNHGIKSSRDLAGKSYDDDVEEV